MRVFCINRNLQNILLCAFIVALSSTSYGSWWPFSSKCSTLEEQVAAETNPELSATAKKAKLIKERSKLRPTGTNESLNSLRGPGGMFHREYTLESGEKIGVSGLAIVKGQVFRIMFFTVAAVKKQKVLWWEKENWVNIYDTGASSSPREIRKILSSIKKEAQDAGMSLMVIEGDRMTGARGAAAQWERAKDPNSPTLDADREAFMRTFTSPHLQIMIDLQK